MVILRCTQKLLRRLKGTPAHDEASTTKLGDWYGNLLSVGRQRVVLFASERSRFPVLLPARDVANVATHLRLALEQLLPVLGVPGELVRQEIDAMADVRFAPTANRSLLGTMNDYHRSVRFYLDSGTWAELMRLSLYLGENPSLPPDYHIPWELTAQILTGDTSPVPEQLQPASFEVEAGDLPKTWATHRAIWKP